MFGLPDGVFACLFDMDGVVTALVVGVDRVGQAAELREHGADIVVKDLSELLDRDGGTR